MIQDPDVKRIIEHRFFKLKRYSTTVVYFENIMSGSTVDRYIDNGVGAIADSLKLWGIIS
ncbi:hypothetical protein [Paenibacillus pini]|uniref:Uncharacterized protein n=1 Tax=Paenibacillus pini JCM 16418 TaxID=1236976 RepID=W7Y796_9BACL|nr:hypothetical protein [Paenibacillus pini]GAF06805.1 hypothetical protein JCM16418_787 [Paenibacillus pini JCM 16418]